MLSCWLLLLLQSAITSLVDQSVEERYFGKARECTEVLRAAAVQHRQPATFNNFLDKLRDSYESNAAKRGFWMQLMQAGIGPVHDGEVGGAGVSEAQSREYVRVHGAEQQAPPGGYTNVHKMRCCCAADKLSARVWDSMVTRCGLQKCCISKREPPSMQLWGPSQRLTLCACYCALIPAHVAASP